MTVPGARSAPSGGIQPAGPGEGGVHSVPAALPTGPPRPLAVPDLQGGHGRPRPQVGADMGDWGREQSQNRDS